MRSIRLVIDHSQSLVDVKISDYYYNQSFIDYGKLMIEHD